VSPLSRHLLLASFIGTFAETMLAPVWTGLAGRAGGNELDAGVGYALFSMLTGVTILAVGRTSWFNRNLRPMVFWGFLISALGDAGYIVASHVWQVLVIQSVAGIAVGLINPAWDALYCEDMQAGEAVTKWSIWTGGISFAMGIAALLAGLLTSRLGYQALFYAIAAVHVGCLYYAFRVWRD
jgi:predicted MFS family arabinose efflux permease